MAISYESIAVMPKSQEATNLRMNHLNKQGNEQPNIQMEVQKQIEQKMQRTEKTNDKDGNLPKFDAKNKGSNEYYRQEAERKKKEEEKKKEEIKRMLGCTFDITV